MEQGTGGEGPGGGSASVITGKKFLPVRFLERALFSFHVRRVKSPSILEAVALGLELEHDVDLVTPRIELFDRPQLRRLPLVVVDSAVHDLVPRRLERLELLRDVGARFELLFVQPRIRPPFEPPGVRGAAARS